MNEQQLAELKRIKAILSAVTGLEDDDQEYIEDARKALQSIISQDALDKMAENARELGLSYDDAIKGGVGIMLGGKRIDPASIYAEPKIGCVNHDCDKCKEAQPSCPECVFGMCHCGAAGGQKQPAPVQEFVPPAQEARAWLDERGEHELADAVSNLIVAYRKSVHATDKNSEKSFVSRMDAGLCGGAQPASVQELPTDEQIIDVLLEARRTGLEASGIDTEGLRQESFAVGWFLPYARAVIAAFAITGESK